MMSCGIEEFMWVRWESRIERVGGNEEGMELGDGMELTSEKRFLFICGEILSCKFNGRKIG